jgi:hypothetical protein
MWYSIRSAVEILSKCGTRGTSRLSPGLIHEMLELGIDATFWPDETLTKLVGSPTAEYKELMASEMSAVQQLRSPVAHSPET